MKEVKVIYLSGKKGTSKVMTTTEEANRILDSLSGTLTKREVMLNPPNEVKIKVKVPDDILTEDQLHDYLWENFHIDLDVDPNSDNYGDLFYNSDLRSYMGFIEGFAEFVIFPEYYIDRDDPSSSWSKMWRALIRQSEIVMA